MAEKAIDLDFGAMAEPLLTQLVAGGWEVDPQKVDHWQRDSDAITRVNIRGLVADSTCTTARGRLFKTICKELARIHVAQKPGTPS